jgi:chaperonin GroES
LPCFTANFLRLLTRPTPFITSLIRLIFQMSKIKIKPVGDRILVQHAAEKEQVRGGVIIPDSAKEKPQEAQVIALGTGPKAKDGTVSAFEVKVGDTVLIGKFAGSEVKLDNQKYTLVREDDILGVIA